ncbi:MAG: cytochrome c oxidase subunit, partial [Pseudonocardiales bacterium]|nr:cytochrome c oxidase subunit [Pseudonocardiales bacterium]
LAVAGLGTILGAVNMVTTIVCLRAPGMTIFRMPIFTWNILVTSILVLLAFPILTSALLVLWVDRHLGAQVFEAANGGPVLWQHLFWFFGHPEVYIVALPFFGIITEVIPVFSRTPLFGYKGMVLATLGITGLSLTVWAHHMFATGVVLLPFFAFLTYLIAVPTGLKFFNWIGTMWRGSITFDTPMLWSLGFMVTFLFGGLTGVILASPPLDFHLTDSYFVVAHFHYVLFGTIVFAAFAGVYFWFPKYTGRYMDERLGKLHFWLTFIGFHTTFLIQHWLGAKGMPRRYADYLPGDGFTTMHMISSLGSFVLGASMLPFLYNVYTSYRFGELATQDDPWGHGNSLEWATSCPPPRHNFTSMPRIRSERPAFEAHYPHLIPQLEREAHADKRHHHPLVRAGAEAVGGGGGEPRSQRDPDPGQGGCARGSRLVTRSRPSRHAAGPRGLLAGQCWLIAPITTPPAAASSSVWPSSDESASAEGSRLAESRPEGSRPSSAASSASSTPGSGPSAAASSSSPVSLFSLMVASRILRAGRSWLGRRARARPVLRCGWGRASRPPARLGENGWMTDRPGAQVLAAYGLSGGSPKPLAGGQGHAWKVGPVVLKPVGNQAEADWVAELLPTVRQLGFRLSQPVPSRTGNPTVHGWTGWHWLAGHHDFTDRWPEVLRAGAALHRALAAVAEPAFLAQRDDHWSIADRLSWTGALPAHHELRRPAEQLAAQLRPTRRPSQLIHGDLTGNVLFADPAAPGIIDFTPYWRPASYGLAVVVADAVAWHGAGQPLLDAFVLHEPIESRSMLARAALFRLLTADRIAAAGTVPASYLRSNAEAYRKVGTVLGVC